MEADPEDELEGGVGGFIMKLLVAAFKYIYIYIYI